MSTNFMTAGTEIGSYVDKYNQCLHKIANITAQACVDRAKSGKVNDGLKTDISNLIKDLPLEDKNKVLLQVCVELSKQITGSSNSDDDNPYYFNGGHNKKKRKPSMSDIFDSRGY